VEQDRHFTSLFSKSISLSENKKSIISIKNFPKPPAERITITPNVIKSAKRIVLMTAGSEKG
jgi:6-phosphogluconolactonase